MNKIDCSLMDAARKESEPEKALKIYLDSLELNN